MQRKFEARTRGELFVERVAWNAAAVAALAVMVLILLCSLQWLDRLAPQTRGSVAPVAPIQLARPALGSGGRSGEGLAVDRPSG